MSSLVHYSLPVSGLSCAAFRRLEGEPLFVVREFDLKIIRSAPKYKKSHATSEQAIRASIRQAILNMGLQSFEASKSEIRVLKGAGILGKRAPSCSLLAAGDMMKLLRAFGKQQYADQLMEAMMSHRIPVSVSHEELKEAERKFKFGIGRSQKQVVKHDLPQQPASSPTPTSPSSSPSPSLDSPIMASALEAADQEEAQAGRKRAFIESTSINHAIKIKPATQPRKKRATEALGDFNGLEALFQAASHPGLLTMAAQ